MNKQPDRKWAYDIVAMKEQGKPVSPWALELAWSAIHLDQQMHEPKKDDEWKSSIGT